MPNMSGWHGSKFGEGEEVQEGGGSAVPLHLGRLPRLRPRAELQAGGRGGGLHLPAPPAEKHQGPGALSRNIYNISTIIYYISTRHIYNIHCASQDEAAAGQEALLHHRAKVLKYQGMYLQFQARLLEREAHAHYSHIKAEPGLGLGAGNDTHHFYVAADGLDTRAPAPQPPPQYEPGYGGEEETETPLDLSLQKPASPANYLHTQAENMPRIFFSLSNAPIPSATKQN